MTKNIRVLVVDDQPRARRSMKALLATWPQVTEMQEAADGREAVRMAQAFVPDLVLMDAKMPEMDGVEASRMIKLQQPNIKVVVLSMYSEYREAVRAAGADAFISKGEPPATLLATLTALVNVKTP